MKPFNRLSWKFAVITALLVSAAILIISVPAYWLTRNTLEDQLADHLQTNIEVIAEKLDPAIIALVCDYPGPTFLKDSLVQSLSAILPEFSASSIYLIDDQNKICLIVGNQASALQSQMIHQPEIQKALQAGSACSPLFSDNAGKTYKSVFKTIGSTDHSPIVLGLDANAQFLKYTEQLRRRMLSIGFFVLIVSILAVMILSRTLTRPLSLLTKFAEDIGKGRAEPTILQKRQDEIGFLGKTMEHMRREIDRREKENKQLIASVAHEIRNPLAGMRVNAELLLEATQDIPDISNYSRAVANEINNLSNIVENFLTYAQPIEATLTSYSIRLLIEETLTQIRQDFPEHHFRIEGDGLALLHPGKIKHAFFNLLKNACEATPKDEEILISIKSRDQKTNISIFNKGTPMPAEVKPQIFDAFFSTKSTGVGLGLSITKSIVKQHGGRIFLTRSDAGGTEFVLELPAG
jgi:two-component system OmpR family sensor kinase